MSASAADSFIHPIIHSYAGQDPQPSGGINPMFGFFAAHSATTAPLKPRMADGGFPIGNDADVRAALANLDRATDLEATKKWIVQRARDLGCLGLVPREWLSYRDRMAARSTATVLVKPDMEAFRDMLAAVTVTVDEAADAPAAESRGWTTDPGLCFEGIPTEDGRFLVVGSTAWRDLPLTLMAQVETASGHDGAQVAGRIDAIRRVEDGETAVIEASGIFDRGEFGQEIERMVADEVLRGVSVDLAVLDYAFRDPETGEILDPDEMSEDDWMRAFLGELQFAVLDSQIMGATVCPFPAFGDARVKTLTASADGQLILHLPAQLRIRHDLTASAAPVAPPRDWFEVPPSDTLDPITITDDGQVFGFAATFDCHQGYQDSCVIAPRSKCGLAYFHTGEMQTAEGDLIPIGRITVRGPHADLALGRTAAKAHYDDVCTVAAYVTAVETPLGIWVSGALRSDITPEQLRDMRANPPSGDWRSGELIALHCVPVQGLPVPRTQARVMVASSGIPEVATLIAAPVCDCIEPMSEQEYDIRIEALADFAGLDDE